MRYAFRLAASSLLLLAAAAFGCGRPFNIKTQPDLPPASYAAEATAGGVVVAAQAMADEDFLFDTFDANLISAGVLPVRVSLKNSGGEAVDLKGARFQIETNSRRLKAVDARKAFKRLISYYEISTYTKAGYAESLQSFSAFSLDLATPLGAGQTRQGLVFFLAPSESASQTGMTLIIGRLDSRNPAAGVSIRLN